MKSIKFWAASCLTAILGCLFSIGCADEGLGDSNVVEGLPASITMKMVVPNLSEAVVTRAGVEQETSVNELLLLFYDRSDTSKPAFAKTFTGLTNYVIGSEEGNESNRIYTISISPDDVNEVTGGTETFQSGRYYLYAVANWNNGFCRFNVESLKTMSLDKLKAAQFDRKDGNALDIINYTPMSGVYGRGDGSIDINPGDNTFTEHIHLRRATAKVIFDIKSAEGITFKPIRYHIYKYSQSSTLMERSGWTGTHGTKPGDNDELGYDGNGNFTDFTNQAFTDDNPNGFEFYMLENVQTKKKSVNGNKLLREKRVGTDDETFAYAPDKSTYVVIEGDYEGPGENASTTCRGHVKYTIQLGDFADSEDEQRGGPDNYTIRRNVKYTYTVTVAGVNNIITEAQAMNFDDEKQPGAEGDLIQMGENTIYIPLDAHYEKVLLKIKADQIQNPFFYVNTPYSKMERLEDGISISDTEEEAKVIPEGTLDYKWIEFTKPQSGSLLDGLKYGKYNTDRATIYGLLKDIKEGKQTYYTKSGDYVYTTAYVNEYFYEKNPLNDTEDAKLADFVNTANRTMNICTSKYISVDGKSTYVANTIISFTQNSIWTIYPTDGSVAIPFGIEKKDEWETTAGMLRGGASATLTNENGWTNTKSLIAAGMVDQKNSDVTAGYLAQAIGSGSTTWKSNSSSYGVSYLSAMSRNRDVNDDGVISDDELKWYVPARNQCVALWLGNRVLGEYRPYNAADLVSNVESDLAKVRIHTSSGGSGAIWWAAEGTSFSAETNKDKDYYGGVRCIRNLSSTNYKGAPTQFSSISDRTISIANLSDDCLRTSSMSGEYAAVHTERQEVNRPPRAFQVAKNNLSITTTTGVENPNVKGTASVTVTSSSWNTTYTGSYKLSLTITDLPSGASVTCSKGSLENEGGGNYTLSFTATGRKQIAAQSIIIYAKVGDVQSSGVVITCPAISSTGTQAPELTITPKTSSVSTSSTSLFSIVQIEALANLAAANYSEEADGSDKGQWRVPNQRELALMMVYWDALNAVDGFTDFELSTNTSVSTKHKYASCTFLTSYLSTDPSPLRYCPFHMDCSSTGNQRVTLDTSFFNTYLKNKTTAGFYIRPVRDVEAPVTPTTTKSSSSYYFGKWF